MTDLIALAKERRARLTAEVAKLDEFIQMAGMLVKYGTSKSGAEEGDDERAAAAVVRPMPRG
ncbi:MAG TPA: hypothetical protein VLA52_14735 [Thermohalobaculum sp.]|nr:hypothetical protein [Thermohalobaculum sp.]